jgi:hypothetical protein
MVEILPGNTILVAGAVNAGKTALLLNIVRDNMADSKVHYFNSEMGASELRKRLSLFDNPLTLEGWEFSAHERLSDFGDVIRSGAGVINVIDYLEVYEDFYKVGGLLAEIHKRLDGAVAVVALQKNPGLDIPMGGYRGLEKPRLALALDSGRVKIVKAKNWKGRENPNQKVRNFKLINGCKFVEQGGWHLEEDGN